MSEGGRLEDTKLWRLSEARRCGEVNSKGHSERMEGPGWLWREGKAGRWRDSQKGQNWTTGSGKRVVCGGNGRCQLPGVQVRVIRARWGEKEEAGVGGRSGVRGGA